MKMFRLLLLIVALSLMLPAVYGERRRTTRRNLQVRVDSDSAPNQEIWVKPEATWQPVGFCGYEKKQSANKETIFIVNETDSAFSRIRFTIRYFDSSNREIHQRTVDQRLDLPSRRTRRLDFRSWDTQNSYYYIGGPAPRRQATPYNVKITLDSICLRARSTISVNAGADIF